MSKEEVDIFDSTRHSCIGILFFIMALGLGIHEGVKLLKGNRIDFLIVPALLAIVSGCLAFKNGVKVINDLEVKD